jgi:subtilisin family serine protease
VVDQLLGCPRPHQPPPPQAQPSGSAAGGTATPAAPGSTLRELPPHAISATPRFVPDLLMVRFRAGTSAARQAEVLDDAGVEVDHRIARIGVVVVRTDPGRRDAAAARLRSSRWVARAEKDAVLEKLDTTPNDTHWSDQWGLRRIGLPSAWDRTRGGALVVAVLDTGVDATHPDLRGAVLPGLDVVGGTTDSTDTEGHGTSVAGIIAARSDNRQGVAGICWSCSILPVKVLGPDGTGDMDSLAAGIVRATDAGARIVNMSLGGPAGSATLDEAIAYAVARNVVLVAAAGNNGSSAPFYPAANPNVIGVAATDDSDRLYSWSNLGDWVRVTAPGCDPTTALGSTYAIFCGTSAAAPVVSGLVALTLSLQPSASRADIVRAVTDSTDVVEALPKGRIDAPASLSALLPSTVTTWRIRGSLAPGIAARTYRRVVPAGRARATLTFTRRARVTFALTDPTGRVLARVSGRSPLRIERALTAGTYTFSVRRKGRAKVAYSLALVSRP